MIFGSEICEAYFQEGLFSEGLIMGNFRYIELTEKTIFGLMYQQSLKLREAPLLKKIDVKSLEGQSIMYYFSKKWKESFNVPNILT